MNRWNEELARAVAGDPASALRFRKLHEALASYASLVQRGEAVRVPCAQLNEECGLSRNTLRSWELALRRTMQLRDAAGLPGLKYNATLVGDRVQVERV